MRTKEIKNLIMNNETYKLRHKVVSMLYEIKREVKNFPRIEVRIGEARDHKVLGVAQLKDKKIWITKRAVEMNEDALRNIVYHEVVHAVTGFGHDDLCPLMKPTLDNYFLNKDQCMKYLKKYLQRATKLTMVA
jgi:hypothetical protein